MSCSPLYLHHQVCIQCRHTGLVPTHEKISFRHVLEVDIIDKFEFNYVNMSIAIWRTQDVVSYSEVEFSCQNDLDMFY